MGLALLSLTVSGFLSSTLLPGSSEAAFIAFLIYYPEAWLTALIFVGISNSLGSMTSYLIGRLIPNRSKDVPSKAFERVRRYGTPVLFFSFLPIIGDALPLAAGWMKMHAGKSLFFITLGKFCRYGFILAGYFYSVS